MWVLLPLKQFTRAKKRLEDVLSLEQRSALFAAMVNDVLSVLSNHEDIDGITIIADDLSAQKLATQYNVEYLSETELNANGLNQAVASSVQHLYSHDKNDLFVIHGDLPLISADEITQLISSHKRSLLDSKKALTIVPDINHKGSNCLLISPAKEMEFFYGKDSFEQHSQFAIDNDFALEVLEFSGLTRDIDSSSDLDSLIHLVSENHAVHTYDYLKSLGLIRFPSASIDSLELPSAKRSMALLEVEDFSVLQEKASLYRDYEFNNVVTYSRKVFLPITQLCRDVCHYCTFAKTPKHLSALYMSEDDVLSEVRAAERAGCKEALFTLGEKPELRYSAAQKALDELGFNSTLEYVAHLAGIVVKETGLLPHINAGCMTRDEIAMLRPVSASMGIMLESVSKRLCEKGMPHYGSPDKDPEARLETIKLAGEANVPFTTGILIGIGETRKERIESLLAIRDLHVQYGHIQEIIIQNFRAKPDTKMSEVVEPDLDDLLWTIAVARIIFGPKMSIQAPPNLSPGVLPKLIDAGINDWGGVSPITPDFVNPEAPWPHVDKLAKESAIAGKYLQERLTIYPNYILTLDRWLDPGLQSSVLKLSDAEGFPRTDSWFTGESPQIPAQQLESLYKPVASNTISVNLKLIVAKAKRGEDLSEHEIVRLFKSRGNEVEFVCQEANSLRQSL